MHNDYIMCMALYIRLIALHDTIMPSLPRLACYTQTMYLLHCSTDKNSRIILYRCSMGLKYYSVAGVKLDPLQ